jgi:DNA-binding MurR/RpiR family transcriptional regulator
LYAATGLSISELARLGGISRQSVHRYIRRGGLPTYTADRLAVAAHLHPAEVWGWAWYEDSAEAEAS